MKLFCANAFTGENVTEVTDRMRGVVDALNAAGHEAYCPLFDTHKQALQEKGDIPAIFAYAFKNILERDGLVVIVSSSRRSEGLLMEIGAALSASQPVYLFVHKSAVAASSHLPKLAARVCEWENTKDLLRAVQTLLP